MKLLQVLQMLLLIFAFFLIVLDYNSSIFRYSRFTLKHDLGVIGYSASYKGVLVVGLIPISEALASSDLGDSGVRTTKLNYQQA